METLLVAALVRSSPCSIALNARPMPMRISELEAVLVSLGRHIVRRRHRAVFLEELSRLRSG